MKCATCGSIIDSANDALVEWIIYNSDKSGEYKIIHNFFSSPNKPHSCSWHAFQNHDYCILDMDLKAFLSSENLISTLQEESIPQKDFLYVIETIIQFENSYKNVFADAFLKVGITSNPYLNILMESKYEEIKTFAIDCLNQVSVVPKNTI